MRAGGALDPTASVVIGDGLAAGAVAWALSGLPSSTSALVHGTSPLAAVAAAGTLLLGDDAPTVPLVVAGAVAHTALSLGWATVLALTLPERRTVAAGLAAGAAIAALDLGVVARRYPRIRSLGTPGQVADHLAFGAVVAVVVARRRRRRRARRSPVGG
ncbi:MAG: hypothetical protein KY447_05605 [Actinobacteria bacterium]|nr:hypothetical protein [Actinomycetota bacterium]MBW3642372.1 hypothetical protein [Actinomycetota bacterium]